MPWNTGASGPDPDGSAPAEIRGKVLDLIDGRRRTPGEILRALAGGSAARRQSLREAIRELVAGGELEYISEHGRTFLVPSFDRPVRVSDRIVLTPPGRAFHAGPEDVIVRIGAGAAFGAGRHPTTRLALRGIEFAIGLLPQRPGRAVLDIGTGTGVLAIAAVKLGIDRGLGIDIDPGAVAEAGENIGLNGLAGRIEITNRALETLTGPFALVTANLRPPTLEQLAARISSLAEPHGALVLSGLRCEEQDSVVSAYRGRKYECIWESAEDDWAGVVLRRRKVEGGRLKEKMSGSRRPPG